MNSRSRNSRSNFNFSFVPSISSFSLGLSGYSFRNSYSPSSRYTSSYSSYLGGRENGNRGSAFNALAGSSTNTYSGSKDYESNRRNRSYLTEKSNYSTLSPKKETETKYNRNQIKYQGSKTDSEYSQDRQNKKTNTPNLNGLSSTSSSKSSDVLTSVLDRFRDRRSASRETSSFGREISVSKDTPTVFEEKDKSKRQNGSQPRRDSEILLSRDQYRDRTLASRDNFTPISRASSIGPGSGNSDYSYPRPPPRYKKMDSHSSTTNIDFIPPDNSSAYYNTSSPQPIFSRFHSLHDIRDGTDSPQVNDKKLERMIRPPRRQTLASGVSSLDLERARQTFSESNLQGSIRDLRGSCSGSFVDISTASGFNSPFGRAYSLSKSALDLGYDSHTESRRASVLNVPSKYGSQLSVSDIDYKKLWEESQEENQEIRLELDSIRTELTITQQQLEAALQIKHIRCRSDEDQVTDNLEKRLEEMEVEIKDLQKLKSENENLKTENQRLSQIVSTMTLGTNDISNNINK